MTGASVVVVTPWYPTPSQPFAGVFVQDSAASLGASGPLPAVVHVHNVLPDAVQPPVRFVAEGIEVLRIDVATLANCPRPQMARNQREALRLHAGAEIANADTLHAHVGLPAAWAVSGLLEPRQRLVVTEHASYLRRVLADREGLRMYEELVARAAAVMTTTDAEAGRVRAHLPQLRDKVVAWGNPIRPVAAAVRPLPSRLDHWLYVGRITSPKGVHELLPAFAYWKAKRPNATLTLVGDGPELTDARQEAEDLGIGHATRFEGPKDPAEIAAYFHAADVLVHLSHFETFGLTVLEALAAGLPVLVTRCGGPLETTTLAQELGFVRTVAVKESPEGVASALRGLEESVRADVAAPIQEDILDRFGSDAFGARLRAVLDGAPAWIPPSASRPHLFMMAHSARAHRRLARLAPLAVSTQTGITLLSSNYASSHALDPRIRIIDVSREVERHPLHLPEQILIRKVPRWAFAIAHRVLRFGMAAPVLGKVARRIDGLVARVERFHRRAAQFLRNRVLDRLVYTYLDPWIFAKSWEQIAIDRVDFTNVDAMVLTDNDARALLWRLGHRYPNIPIIGVPDREMLSEIANRRQTETDRL